MSFVVAEYGGDTLSTSKVPYFLNGPTAGKDLSMALSEASSGSKAKRETGELPPGLKLSIAYNNSWCSCSLGTSSSGFWIVIETKFFCRPDFGDDGGSAASPSAACSFVFAWLCSFAGVLNKHFSPQDRALPVMQVAPGT